MRVLIFSADIGEGHDAPARRLRAGILARRPRAEVTILDSIEASGRVARSLVRSGSEVVLGRLPWLFDVQYWLITSFPPTRALGRRIAWLVAHRGLLRAVAAHRPDVIVATYPGANQVLGEARLKGLLTVPLVSAITDLAALSYWAHPGTDLHLLIHAESAAEVRAIAGPRTRVRTVRGFSAPEFEVPVDPLQARRGLGLDPDAPVVVVSGGGWGIGDVRGAIAAALRAGPAVQVVVLCGRNEALLRSLQARHAGEPRLVPMGFTDRMGDVFGAADVLVHSTAGLTVCEALVRGVRVISYGWGVGHLRANNAAYRRFGLADVVTDPAELEAAVRRALAAPRAPDLGYGALPAAADAVLELAGG